MPRRNQYDPDKHDDYIVCPRSKCAVRNAPQDSDEFAWSCWKCGAELPVEQDEVQVGDEVEIEIFDIHENGCGVGRMDSGFIVLVDGVLPECYARVEITQVNRSSARADLIEKLPDGPTDTDEDSTTEADVDPEVEQTETADEPSETGPALGSRENYWG